jgi:hypothetical protein
MTAGGTWLFPPGRALHGWFGDLSPRRPQQIWFTHLLLHRVETLAAVSLTHRLDALQTALLRQIAAGLALDRLLVDPQLLAQWLHALAVQGLVRANGDGWEPTPAGRMSVETGTYTKPGQERRTFYFVDQREANRPAHFLRLTRPSTPYPTPGLDYFFDPRWLTSCPNKPPEWKRVHQFPTDVEAVLGALPTNDPKAALAWREVILDRCETLPVVVIGSGTGVQGFPVQTEDWKLAASEPAFELAEDWQVVVPDLAGEPSPDLWRAVWNGWCRQRSLPAAETDGCPLGRRDFQLEVRVSKRLLDRLKTTRNEVLHGDTWLLAGSGRTRTAARVKVVEGDG